MIGRHLTLKQKKLQNIPNPKPTTLDKEVARVVFHPKDPLVLFNRVGLTFGVLRFTAYLEC
jgi:hypothetical protein